ncbi:MAG: LysR family transcriptional regulator [Clostridiales bacterium]|nr:LysR family transcriptional regulator [Clostridiales bacterium]
MNTRSIEYFLKIAELRSFREASRQLHISHQALSQQIKLLESELGVALLERTSVGLTLTEAGKKMYDLFTPAMNHLHDATAEMTNFIRKKKSILKIAYANVLSYIRIVEPVLLYLSQLSPEIQLDVHACNIPEVHDMLMRDDIDLAISVMAKKDEWESTTYSIINNSRQYIIVSDRHPWYQKETVTTDDILQNKLLVYTNRTPDGEEAFAPSVKAAGRIPVENIDTYLAILCQENAFGIVGEEYSHREGNFRLLELPPEYQMYIPTICAYKPLHPNVKVLQKLQQFRL